MRVRVTQVRVAGAMHCTNNLGVMLGGSVNVGADRRHPAAMSTAFCHICRPVMELPKAPSSLTPVLAEIVFMKSFLKFTPKFSLNSLARRSRRSRFRSDAMAQSRAQYESMVATHAGANNVPEALVHRVIVRESKYHPDLVGRGGTIGLMQIKLATARGLGYTGDAAGLRDPDTNLAWGVKYLAGAYRAANGDHSRAVHYYASGYYYAAKRQRHGTAAAAAPVLASVRRRKSSPASEPPKAGRRQRAAGRQ